MWTFSFEKVKDLDVSAVVSQLNEEYERLTGNVSNCEAFCVKKKALMLMIWRNSQSQRTEKKPDDFHARYHVPDKQEEMTKKMGQAAKLFANS